MKVLVKSLPHSEVELTVTVPYEAYEKSEQKAIEALSHEIKVDGFRSGHIPEAVVREKVGEAGVRNAALEFLLPETYSRAVKEEKLDVIAPPKVEIKSRIEKAGDSLVYVARVAVMPQVKVGNYKKIKVKRKKAEVTPKQVEETLAMIQDRFAAFKSAPRAAAMGDRVEVDFEAFDSAGQPVKNAASKNHPLVLGSQVMIPGFEEAVVGMEAGKIKEVELIFPKTYHAKELQEKPVKFKVALHKVEEKIPQPLDDAFIEKVTGVKQTVDEFKKRVETDLLAEIQTRAGQEHDAAVVEEIIKITDIDLPQALVDDEIQYLMEQQKKQVASQGLTWEQYLKHLKKTEEDFKHDHDKPARERLKARFGVQHIMREANIIVSDQEMEKRIAQVEAAYPEKERSKVREYYKKEAPGYLNLKNSLAADKLIDMLSE